MDQKKVSAALEYQGGITGKAGCDFWFEQHLEDEALWEKVVEDIHELGEIPSGNNEYGK